MKQAVEKLLTRIPMYILVGASLALIITASIVLAAAGLLAVSPLAVVATWLVFGGVGVGASYLLGRLYGVHSHLQSALITSSILTLLFTPSLVPTTLAAYAVIACIAQASKFVVVYRGRHIFNPAAFGAMAGGLLQLQFASWWVGSPVLFPLVALAGFAVLYKTRQLALGGVFLLTALFILAIRGVDIWTALSSWPLVFLAAFMLSEPATLPVRRWQKMTVAVTVATITSLPFHVSWFYSSPEFALLVGNIVAFWLAFSQRAGLRLKLVERRPLTPTADELVFAPSRPVAFTAGQFIELTLSHPKPDMRGIRRSFSLTNAPGDEHLRLGVKFYEPSSSFKRALRAMPIGTIVQTTGIAGEFVLPQNPHQKLLFIAGGIGITPFISHILACNDQPRDIILLYFVRDATEIAYTGILDQSSAQVRYVVEPHAPLEQTLGAYASADLSERVAYISGPPQMVAQAASLLRGKVQAIKTDYFSGY